MVLFTGVPPANEAEEIEPLNICEDAPEIKAVAMLGDGVTYAFNGTKICYFYSFFV